MPAYTITSAWTQITHYGTDSLAGYRYSIRGTGTRRITFAEAPTQPTADVVGIDLEPGTNFIEPNDSLWLRVADGFGPCRIEVDGQQGAGGSR